MFNPDRHNLGYIPDKDVKTITDIGYSAVEKTFEYPKEYIPTDNPIPDYQNGQPECVAEGVSYAMRLWSKKLYNEDWNPSEVYLYAMAEKKEAEMAGRDYPTPGTWIKLALSVAQHNGVARESVYNVPFSLPFRQFADWNRIPLEAHEDAHLHKIGLWARLSFNTDEIRDAIWKYGGVIIAIKGWTQGWFQEVSFPSQVGKWWLHCIVLDAYKFIDGDLAFRERNWWDKNKSNRGNGYAWSWMKWRDWKPFIQGMYAITKYLPPTIMYQLLRDPQYQNEVYAVKGNVWRHITNKQTLELGAKEPDKFWDWSDGKTIPVAPQEEYAQRIVADEICLLPKDL